MHWILNYLVDLFLPLEESNSLFYIRIELLEGNHHFFACIILIFFLGGELYIVVLSK